jgi:hypothetical protein
MTQLEHSGNQIKLSDAKAGSPEETFARICRFSLLCGHARWFCDLRQGIARKSSKASTGEQYCSLGTAQGRCPPAAPLLHVNIGAWFQAAARTRKLPSFLKPENHAGSIGYPPSFIQTLIAALVADILESCSAGEILQLVEKLELRLRRSRLH